MVGCDQLISGQIEPGLRRHLGNLGSRPDQNRLDQTRLGGLDRAYERHGVDGVHHGRPDGFQALRFLDEFLMMTAFHAKLRDADDIV